MFSEYRQDMKKRQRDIARWRKYEQEEIKKELKASSKNVNATCEGKVKQ